MAELHYEDSWLTIYSGDCRAAMRLMPEKSVQTVITSPPYYGLREYGTASWEGGDPDCEHTRVASGRGTNIPQTKNPNVAYPIAPHRGGNPNQCVKCGAIRVEPTVWGGDLEHPHMWGPEAVSSQRLRNGAEGGLHDGRPGFEAETSKDFVQTNLSNGSFCGCGAWRGALGLEPTPEMYTDHLVEVFREVRRVLRDDGVVWLNLGDSYANDTKWGGSTGGKHVDALHGNTSIGRSRKTTGLKAKDLIGIPWRAAFALQQPRHVGPIKTPEGRAWLAAMLDSDGTMGIRAQRAKEDRGENESYIPYLAIAQTDTAALEHAVSLTGMGRITVKAEAGTEDGRGIRNTRTFYQWRLDGRQARTVIREVYPYLLIKRRQAQVVNAMAESLAWGRPSRALPVPPDIMAYRRRLYAGIKALNQREVADLPEMPSVQPADEPGWYLRSEVVWVKPNAMPASTKDRPTSSHESIFMLTKEPHYFFDMEAVKEPVGDAMRAAAKRKAIEPGRTYQHDEATRFGKTSPNRVWSDPEAMERLLAGRHMRDVLTIATKPYPGAHFAVFPPKLVEPLLKATTSEKGACPECGAPWRRVTEAIREPRGDAFGRKDIGEYDHGQAGNGYQEVVEVKTLGWERTCGHDGEPVPCVVMDPFGGSGTVAMVAQQFGRRAVLVDLNPDYIEQQLVRNAQTPLGLT